MNRGPELFHIDFKDSGGSDANIASLFQLFLHITEYNDSEHSTAKIHPVHCHNSDTRKRIHHLLWRLIQGIVIFSKPGHRQMLTDM